MKKIIIAAIMAISTLGIYAQRQQMTPEQIQERRAQSIKNQAERYAKSFKLDGQAKTDFIATFSEYRNELMATMDVRSAATQQKDDKNLSDAEAQARIDEFMQKQQKDIENSQKRLDIHKKYLEIFSKTLKPQYLAQIFREQGSRNNMNRNPQGGQRGNFGGRNGFGGPRGGNDNFGGGNFPNDGF